MRSEGEYRRAVELIRAGVNDCKVGRRLAIPRGTIREWRVGLAADSAGRTKYASVDQRSRCFRCDGGEVDEKAYAYLLGAYLGDGWLSSHARGVYRLRIACDQKYAGIIDEIASRIVSVRGVDKVGFTVRQGCIEVYAFWKHWPCLFPQHGLGRKHERPINLADWQEKIVLAHPKALLRGLVHSDGNRHINGVVRQLRSGPRRYQYPRYMFTNVSNDIREIFTNALDLLGVHWTRTTARDISVARRRDVAFLDTFIGAKS
ncbi:MAG TPA: hypothetical protein VJ796_03460 [Acidimicrobiia bacterium]|nr:hypothetical protein [Acidimicrobiia bacterium]